MVLAVHSVAAFISFLVFLVNGQYRTLIDRILCLRLIPPSARVSREVSFEYLNRQLVWHAFTEFLLFILPIVGISRWRRWLSKAWQKAVAGMRLGRPDEELARGKGQLASLPERTCAICYQVQNPTAVSESDILSAATISGGIVGSAQTDIANPYETIPCGCIYCFVCITQRLEAEEGEGWVCLRCGELVRQCKPWNGDVVEEVRGPSMGKIVGFAITEGADDDLMENAGKAYGSSTTSRQEDSGPVLDMGMDETLQHSSQWSSVERESSDLDSDPETVK
jgi:peroxin-2